MKNIHFNFFILSKNLIDGSIFKTNPIPILLLFIQIGFPKDNAQNKYDPYEEDRNYLSIGYGPLSFFKYYSTLPDYATNFHIKDHGVFIINFDKGIYGRLSAGFKAGYALQILNYETPDFSNPNNFYSHKTTRHAFNLLGNLKLHFYTVKHLDLYTNLGIGLRYIGYQYKTYTQVSHQNLNIEPDKPILFPLAAETTFGVRYSPLYPICFYFELGLSQSIINAGLVVSFKGQSTHVRETFY